MKVMSLNVGSSSLKFCLFNMQDESVIAKGRVERIGIEGSNFWVKFNGEVIKQELEVLTHSDALKLLLDKLISLNIISSFDDIKCVGHRVVHGGDYFRESVVVDDNVLKKLEEIKGFAVLHNPISLEVIRACLEMLPNSIMTVSFDTAFHHTIDKDSYIYAVPYKWYSDYGIKKYGFHGISHQFIANTVKRLLGKDEYKLISCHIGNGVSITAIKDGKSVDTSMGFTPLSGAVMGTRCGDIDVSIIPFIMEKEGKNASEVIDDLNKHSGLLGLSEYSGNLYDIIEKSDEQDPKSVLAKNKFIRKIVDYIAQYYVLLGGADVIVFTGGVESIVSVRREICEKLSCLGVEIDLDNNNICGQTVKISSKNSKIDVYVIPTDEELMIARDAVKLIQ